MKALVLIGDIVDSRKTADRGALQKQFENTIKTLNRKRRNLLSPYTITLGDEFQAVFDSARRPLTDAISIQAAMHPTQFRFSFSIGEITTELNERSAIGMDGPAFYLAREGIESLKRGRDYEKYRVAGVSTDADAWINSCLNLVALTGKTWKKTRLNVLVEHFSRSSAREIAAKLKISDKAVYKNISDGGLDDVRTVFQHIGNQLEAELRAA